jgi:sugar phosphate isomerase/epimerase
MAAARLERPLGIQLYTVRSTLPKDPAGVFRKLASIGYREMEGRLAQVEGHFPLLSELGLQWVNWMIPTSAVTGNWDLWQGFMNRAAAKMKASAPPEPRQSLSEIIEIAKRHGVRNLGISYLIPEERAKLQQVIESANRAAEQCQRAGLTFYYHNHAWEFQGAPGKRPFDLLSNGLASNVKFEIDVFWASLAGQDPAQVLSSCKGRVLSVHLKDIAREAPIGFSELDAPHEYFKDAGDGRLDWPALLRAANGAGVRHYFVEQDYPAGDPVESAAKSYRFLRQVNF